MAESLTPYINIADSMINSINIGGSISPNLKASSLQKNVENDIVENDIVKNDIKQTDLLTEIRDTQVDSLKYVLESNSILKKQYQFDVDKERRDRAQQAELNKELSKGTGTALTTTTGITDNSTKKGDTEGGGFSLLEALGIGSALKGSSKLLRFGGLTSMLGGTGYLAAGKGLGLVKSGLGMGGTKGVNLGNVGKGVLKSIKASGLFKVGGPLAALFGGAQAIGDVQNIRAAEASGDIEAQAQAEGELQETIGSTAGTIIGGALGTVLGPLGTIAGGFVGGKIGGLLGGFYTSDAEKEVKYKDRIELNQSVLKGRYKKWGTAYFDKDANNNWRAYKKRDSWFGSIVGDRNLIAYLNGETDTIRDEKKEIKEAKDDAIDANKDEAQRLKEIGDEQVSADAEATSKGQDLLTQSQTTYDATTSGTSTRTETITGSKEALEQREKDLENAGKVFDTESGLIYDNIYNSANDFTQDGLKNMYKEHYVEALPKAEYLLNGNTKESKAFYKIWNEDEDKAIRMLSGMLNIHGSMYKADGKNKSTRAKMIATDKANLVYNMSANAQQIEHISTNAVEDALKAAWSKGNTDKIKTDTTFDIESPDDIMTMGPMPTDTDEPEQKKSFFETVKSIFGFGKKDKPDSQGPVNTELGRLKETMGTDYSALDSLARTTLQQSGIENPTEFQVEKMRNSAEVENDKIKFGAYVVQGRVLTPSEQQEFIKLADPADPYNIKNAMSPEAQKLLNSFDPSYVNDISKNVVKKATALEGPEAPPGQPIMMNNISQPVNNNTTVSNTTKNYGNIETTQDSYVDKISQVY